MGTSAALAGPAAANGTNIVKIILPGGLGQSVTLEQDLGRTFQANSAYTLSLSLDQGTASGLLDNSTLYLRAGTTTEATMSGTLLQSLIDSSPGFQTVTLSYTTGSVVPTGDIDIYFQDSSLLSFGSTIFLDNVQLTVAPVVPEPRTNSLMGLFAVIVLIQCWRRKRDLPTYHNRSTLRCR